MNQCKECGANLPESARFCFQCGAAVPPPETAPAESPSSLDFVQPALAGGMFLGLLSSLPLINMGNCFCCMWVLGGGGIAAFLVTKQRPGGITYGDGAFAGVLSGLVGAVVGTLVSIPMRILSARMFGSQQQAVEEMMKDVPGFEGPMKDLMMRALSSEISAMTITFEFFANVLTYSLLAMIGGILTVAILNKRKGAGMNPRLDIPS